MASPPFVDDGVVVMSNLSDGVTAVLYPPPPLVMPEL